MKQLKRDAKLSLWKIKIKHRQTIINPMLARSLLASKCSLLTQTNAKMRPFSEVVQPQIAGKHRPKIPQIRQMGTKLARLPRISSRLTILHITKEIRRRAVSGSILRIVYQVPLGLRTQGHALQKRRHNPEFTAASGRV